MQAKEIVVRNKIRVAVVDDDEDVRQSIEDVLSRTLDLFCVGCFSNAKDALAALPGLCPDLVLMEVRLPGLNGIECTERLRRAMPHVKVVMLTVVHDADSVARSSEAGAVGYLTKPVTTDQCLAALRIVFKVRDEDCLRLSRRENEVMRLLAEGLLYKEVADRMAISCAVVHKLTQRIFVKLHVNNRTEAIIKWRT